MSRRRLVAGNWKLNAGPHAARRLALAIRAGWDAGRAVTDSPGGSCAPSPRHGKPVPVDRPGGTPPDVVVFPPFVSLPVVVECFAGSGIAVGSQDLFWEPSGAFTGEVSAPMIRESGATCTLVGHSERRHLFGETDEMVMRKTRAAVAAGLVPIVCVGETLEERERGDTRAVLERQFTLGPGRIPAHKWGDLVLAYEPVWAIGTGRNATPETAREAHAILRELVRQHGGHERGAAQRILYGGSVNAENSASYFGEEEVDGVLVGGASLNADAFLKIIEEAGIWSRS